MKDTKIRWAGSTWNPMTGCTHVSEECDRCYAEVIAEKFTGSAFPNGFAPTYKPNKLSQPATWARGKVGPTRVFVNSMSDVHHEDFTDEQIASVYDVMLEVPAHDYLVLTKRPKRMASFLLGADKARHSYEQIKAGKVDEVLHTTVKADGDGYLARRGLGALPSNIWLGTSIGLDKYAWRADWLRTIPVPVRFLSCEPLLGPLPSLDLHRGGISWVIVGGESGNGRNDYRPMEHEWARDLRDRCADLGVAFFFKQSSGARTETGITLDGQRYEEFPRPHPTAPGRDEATLGRYVDAVA